VVGSVGAVGCAGLGSDCLRDKGDCCDLSWVGAALALGDQCSRLSIVQPINTITLPHLLRVMHDHFSEASLNTTRAHDVLCPWFSTNLRHDA